MDLYWSKINYAPFTIIFACMGALVSCQIPRTESKVIDRTPDIVHVSTGFQGVVTGYHCAGAPDIKVATIEKCGGAKNVETVLFDQTHDINAARLDPSTPDVMGKPAVIGGLNATFALPSALMDVAADPARQLSEHMSWGCVNCTMELGGSRFVITTPRNITRRAFTDNTAGAGATVDVFNLRLRGCMQLKETSGLGTFANKSGYMCSNSFVSFDQNLSGKGSLNYRITLSDRLRG
jgi:hypothetical protein